MKCHKVMYSILKAAPNLHNFFLLLISEANRELLFTDCII
jgi:hypothetical protein